MTADLAREAARQQALLRVLWRAEAPEALQPWLRADGHRGVQAYRANAGALAERALGAALPTVAALLGEESFAALARACWHASPPRQGDIGTWGEGVAEFVRDDAQLADLPWLADVARLEWAVHVAETAADDEAPPQALDLLAAQDPSALRLVLRAGHQVLSSRWPLFTLWQAHREAGPDRFAPVRQALAEGRAEAVRVRRDGPRVRAEPVDDATARFERALLNARPLVAAWQQAGDSFDFEDWFLATLRRGGLSAVVPIGVTP
ncbi:MAG: putative DNA-binding domain-containing protein [Rubrivivax sp.]